MFITNQRVRINYESGNEFGKYVRFDSDADKHLVLIDGNDIPNKFSPDVAEELLAPLTEAAEAAEALRAKADAPTKAKKIPNGVWNTVSYIRALIRSRVPAEDIITKGTAFYDIAAALAADPLGELHLTINFNDPNFDRFKDWYVSTSGEDLTPEMCGNTKDDKTGICLNTVLSLETITTLGRSIRKNREAADTAGESAMYFTNFFTNSDSKGLVGGHREKIWKSLVEDCGFRIGKHTRQNQARIAAHIAEGRKQLAEVLGA